MKKPGASVIRHGGTMNKPKLAVFVLLSLGVALPTAGAGTKAQPQVLTCTLPVGPKDTAATVRKRFGAAAVRTKISGAEGMEIDGIVLWPKDPARRLELYLSEDKALRITGVGVLGKSRWQVGGLQLGDGIAKVQQLNGKPFKLSGFDWDYGGFANDMQHGKLDKLPGGCNLSIRFEPGQVDPYPEGISGEVTLSSADPKVRAAKPVVDELSISWPVP